MQVEVDATYWKIISSTVAQGGIGSTNERVQDPDGGYQVTSIESGRRLLPDYTSLVVRGALSASVLLGGSVLQGPA